MLNSDNALFGAQLTIHYKIIDLKILWINFCFTGLPQREVDGPTTPTRPKPNGATRKRRATEAVRRTVADARTHMTQTDRGATRARRREGLTDALAQEAETGQRFLFLFL